MDSAAEGEAGVTGEGGAGSDDEDDAAGDAGEGGAGDAGVAEEAATSGLHGPMDTALDSSVSGSGAGFGLFTNRPFLRAGSTAGPGEGLGVLLTEEEDLDRLAFCWRFTRSSFLASASPKNEVKTVRCNSQMGDVSLYVSP